MNNASILVEEVTNLLTKYGCITNENAILELAIYIVEREKKILENMLEPLDTNNT